MKMMQPSRVLVSFFAWRWRLRSPALPSRSALSSSADRWSAPCRWASRVGGLLSYYYRAAA